MKKVTTVAQIIKLANEGKCIVHGNCRIPCAFVQNYPARTLHMMIKAGQIYFYKPKTSKKK